MKTSFGLFLLLILGMLSQESLASSLRLIVKSEDASVFLSPSNASASGEAFKVSKNKLLESDGTLKNGFYKLHTKSGKSLWIRQKDVSIKKVATEEDLVSSDESGETNDSDSKKSEFRRWRFDIGASTGTATSGSFYEINLAASYFSILGFLGKMLPFSVSLPTSIFSMAWTLQSKAPIPSN